MNKQEFLTKLEIGLSGLPQEDIDERLTFYSEIIDDRIEEGISEEEAVCEIGSIDELISQIMSDIPISRLVKEAVKPKRRFAVWEMVLLVLGSPIWFSLLIAAFAIILSFYISLWSVIVSIWAIFILLISCTLGGIAVGIGFACGGMALTGVAMIGAGIVCAGLSILLLFGCKAATKGVLLLTKKIALSIKNCFIRR